MSQNVVPSVATGDIMTAANWNLQVRDNINGLNVGTTEGDMAYWSGAAQLARLAIDDAFKSLAVNAGGVAPEWVDSLQSLLTAQGDLIIASAANTPARLAKGTARQLLSMNAGETAPEWATQSLEFCVLSETDTTVQISTGGGFTTLAWDTDDSDLQGWHDPASNPSRITVTESGWYIPSFNASWAINVNGMRLLNIALNGGVVWQANTPGTTSGSAANFVGGMPLYMAAGEYVETSVHQDSGGPLNVSQHTFGLLRIA